MATTITTAFVKKQMFRAEAFRRLLEEPAILFEVHDAINNILEAGISEAYEAFCEGSPEDREGHCYHDYAVLAKAIRGRDLAGRDVAAMCQDPTPKLRDRFDVSKRRYLDE
jgi:hypothetical protein